MKQEQEELAFDRKILEQLLAQSKAEQQEQAERKVDIAYCWRFLSNFFLLLVLAVTAFMTLWPILACIITQSVHY